MLALSRKLGDRPTEWAALSERAYALFMLGRWDEARASSEEFTPEQIVAGGVMLSLLQVGVEIHVQRGELDDARRVFAMYQHLEESSDVQDRAAYLGSRACLRRAEGGLREALADGEATIETSPTLGVSFQGVKQGIVEALEAAFALGETAKMEELLAFIESIPPGSRAPFLDAQARRFRARLAGGDRSGYEAAVRRFREARAAVLGRGHAARARRSRRPRRGARDLRAARGCTLAGASRGGRGRAARTSSRLTSTTLVVR